MSGVHSKYDQFQATVHKSVELFFLFSLYFGITCWKILFHDQGNYISLRLYQY